MNKFKFKTAFILAIITLWCNKSQATILTYLDTQQIFTDPKSIDIDRDGLWDVKLSLPTNGNEIKVELAFASTTNYSLLKVYSEQDPTPLTYNKDIDMNMAGLWVYSSNGYGFIIQKTELSSSGKYIGIKLKKGNVEYCAWLYLYSYMGDFCGGYAYQNDGNSCLKTGEVQKNSSVNTIDKYSNIFIFPNPASNEVSLQNIPTSEFSFKVVDMMGKEVLFLRNVTNLQQIDISALTNGVYYYKILINEFEIHADKLVKL